MQLVKIVCPRFVNSHYYLFQSYIKTLVASQALLEYYGHLLLGRVTFYKLHDVYPAQLGAATKAIHYKLTILLDHSHLQPSKEHITQCAKASIKSGIQSIYCFAPYRLPKCINHLKFSYKPHELHQQQIFAMAKAHRVCISSTPESNMKKSHG